MHTTLHIKKEKVSDLTVKELEEFIEAVIRQTILKYFSSDIPIGSGVIGNQGFFIEPKPRFDDGTILCKNENVISI